MKEVVLNKPGEFAIREDADPTREMGEALVRVHRIGVCGTDLHAFAGRQPYFNYPRILGHELGVEVIEIGENAAGLAAGDHCSVEPYINCGRCIACRKGRPNCCVELRVLGVHADGGMRPFLTVPARKLHRSRTLSFEQLALVETLGIGAHAVERANLERGEVALVIGAGPIGLSVVQFALTEFANVIVMDLNDRRLEFCSEHFAVSATLNPGEDEAEQALRKLAGDLPTVIFDATGFPPSMERTFELAAHGGRIVFVSLVQADIRFNDPNFHKRELTLLATRNSTPETFNRIITYIESGDISTDPWITHRMELYEVPEQFPNLPKEPGLVKAMIEVSDG